MNSIPSMPSGPMFEWVEGGILESVLSFLFSCYSQQVPRIDFERDTSATMESFFTEHPFGATVG